MKLRFLAILILLTPTLYGVGSLTGQRGHASAKSKCCEVVEVISCCGEVSYEKTCPATDSSCQCTVRPGGIPLPNSLPMLPIAFGNFVFQPPMLTELVFEAAVDAPVILPLHTRAAISHSYSETQAILGVWRI